MKIKTIITCQLLWLSLISFGQATTTDDFSLTIKFDKIINVDSLDIFFYETLGQSFNSINYSTDKSNNTITIFGNNDYVIGTKFPTLVFLYRTFELKKYMCADSLNKNNRLPCRETIETLHLFYLITGPGIGSYREDLSGEIKFTLNKSSVMITKEWVPDTSDEGNVRANYVITAISEDQLTYGHTFNENLSISNKLTKINQR